jgi:N-sulfoglucosamine sulfohydrolase
MNIGLIGGIGLILRLCLDVNLPYWLLMSKLPFFILSLALICAAFAEKPNMVFIIADDCTFRDIGCYGGQAKTPHIDKLATEGMLFNRCLQAAPMCSPTRHNIYTGIYPVKSGAYPNHTRVYPEVKSIVHHLQPLGYRVTQTGKTHIGPREAFPFENMGGKNPDMAYIDKLFGETAKAKGERPFCLFACSNEPHSPWDKGDASVYPPEKVKLPPYIVDTPEMRDAFSRYLAEITYYDSQVGEILGMLDKHGLRENTMVMVVSEQGNGFPFAKWTCYESGLQSAMVVRWPGKVKAGSVTDAMVEYVDITPTFVDIAGGEPVAPVDGRSFLPVLKGEACSHKEYAYGIMTTKGIINGTPEYPIRSVRDSRYKLILNLNHGVKFTNACTQSKEFRSMVAKAEGGDELAKQLVHAYHWRPEVEFFDLEKDPLEMQNLAGKPEYAERIAHLRKKLDAWMEDQGDLGMETEMRAKERQGGGGKSKKKEGQKK